MSDTGNLLKVETLEELENILATTEHVVVVFGAQDWCTWCKKLAPHVEKAAGLLSRITFLDVDIDHVEGVKENYGIMSVPQVWYYEDAHNGLPGVPVKGRTAIQLVDELGYA